MQLISTSFKLRYLLIISNWMLWIVSLKWGIKVEKVSIAYFLIRFAQTKITLFIFANNWVIRENKSFMLVEPCSHVTCCVEMKLQYIFRKYIFICTIYTLLMKLIPAILYGTCQVHGGSNSWEKPTAPGVKLEQW